MPAVTKPFRVREAFQAQQDLLGNALSLAGTTLATSLLGVGYWWIAARFLTPSSIGYGSAALSAASLLATFGVLGFGSMLMGRVAGTATDPGGLIATGLVTAGAASAALGLLFAILLSQTVPHFVPYAATGPRVLLFVGIVSLTAISLVLDNALLGLFLGSMQLIRNVVFALVKLGLLAVLASRVADHAGVTIIASWSLAIFASFCTVAFLLSRAGKRVVHTPRITALQTSAGSALMHHWLNLATFTPRTAVPLMVTALLSADLNGAFYPAWLVATMVYIIPTHLSISLFAVGSSNPDAFASKTRVSTKLALVIGLPLSVSLAVAAHPLLQLFGGPYAAHATGAFQLLMLAYIPNIARFHYVTIRRVQSRLREASSVMTALGALEVAAMASGARADGLTGMALALMAAMWLEGALTVRPVLRAMAFRTRSDR